MKSEKLKKEIKECPNCNSNKDYAKTRNIKPTILCYTHHGKFNFKKGYEKGYEKSREEELRFLKTLIWFSMNKKVRVRIDRRMKEIQKDGM